MVNLYLQQSQMIQQNPSLVVLFSFYFLLLFLIVKFSLCVNKNFDDLKPPSLSKIKLRKLHYLNVSRIGSRHFISAPFSVKIRSFCSTLESSKKKRFNNILTDTYLDKTLIQKIQKTLPTPRVYNRKGFSYQHKVSAKLDKLFISNKKTDIFNNISSIPASFENEFTKFESEFESLLKKKIPRINSGLFANQLNLYITYLLKKFKTEGIKDIQKVTVKKILRKIKADVFFDKILLQPFSRKAQDTWRQEQTHQCKYSNTELLFISFYSLNSGVATQVLLHLSYLILEKSKSLYSKMEEISNKAFLFVSKTDFKGRKFFQNVPHQLMAMFLGALSIKKKIIYDSKLKKNSVWIEMSKRTSFKFCSREFFFNITPVDNDFSEIPSRIFGKKNAQTKWNPTSSMVLSKKTIKSLNMSQTKKFIINENVLKVFKDLDSLNASCFTNVTLHPFIPKSILKKAWLKVNKLESTITQEEIQKVKQFWAKRNSQAWEKNLLHCMSLSTKLNIKKVRAIFDLSTEKKILNKFVGLRKWHNTLITIAEIFRGYPIYFRETLDYRLRMYPSTLTISRTSGIYKYLLQDFRKRILKKPGLYVLLQAFYKPFTKKFEELEFLKKKNVNKLLCWNKKNMKIDVKNILKCKSPMYQLSLFYEMKNFVNPKLKTGILIEIDQKNSSSVFTALILRDTNLASLCNLDCKENNDLGSWLMLKSKDWYEKKINKTSLKILASHRNIHKKLLMCFYFGQTYRGRMKDLRSFFPSFKDRRTIALEYNNFLNVFLPGLDEKIKTLKSIVRYFLTKTNSKIILKTIDLSRIDWFIPKWNGRKSRSYFIRGLNDEKVCSQEDVYLKKLNIKKMLLGFLACYIHSLDAALMRLVILEIEKKCNYIISHIHDSLQFHPNYYNDVLLSITNTYLSYSWKKVFDKTLINVMRKYLKEDDILNFELLVNQFKSKGQDIKIRKKTFNVKSMYTL